MSSSTTFSNKYITEVYSKIERDIDEDLNKFPSLSHVYRSSIINWEWLFKNISMLSVETSHTTQQLEDMEFFKFDKLLYFINDYLEKKNGDGSNDSATEEFGNMKQDMSSSMNKMKNSMKVPTLKPPKI